MGIPRNRLPATFVAALDDVSFSQDRPAVIANKFNVSAKEARTVDGKVYDSQLEAKVYKWLKQAFGNDFDKYVTQSVSFCLLPGFAGGDGRKWRMRRYEADFVISRTPLQVESYYGKTPCMMPSRDTLVLDAKGMILPVFQFKECMFAWRFSPVVISCVKRKKDLPPLLSKHGWELQAALLS